MTSIKVAVTQAEPCWLNLTDSVSKACDLIAEAAASGAKLVAFSEAWVPGYPSWIWVRPVDPELQTRYTYGSMFVDSAEMERIKTAAKDYSIAVVLGFSERTPSHSLYISQAIISPRGELLLHRRKIKPTHMERTIFGDGSGPDLDNVAEIDFGEPYGKIKVGCLACWEHAQPLLKYHTIAQDEVIHISMWPPIEPAAGVNDPSLWNMTVEGCQNLSQTYAIESSAYVLHATAVFSHKAMTIMRTAGGHLYRKPLAGNSCIIGPDGRRLTEPLDTENLEAEGLLYAELDLTKMVAAKGFLDSVGHYSRPDLLWLGVDKRQKEVVRAQGSQHH
ncbi:carbon-nitrogen hydrolase [Xylariaceae sp. FL0016]|nr:carbon-nitrogen hydrolase [Xylariaceae sp. FL0016]